jgi:hypothetical protein
MSTIGTSREESGTCALLRSLHREPPGFGERIEARVRKAH